jgi:hypothetical protein
MTSTLFGLPVHPSIGQQATVVRDVSGLQPYIDHVVSALGPEFASTCSVDQVVSFFRGWAWLPAAADCPVGSLQSFFKGTLPPCATLEPSEATTASAAPPVVVADLPAWQ